MRGREHALAISGRHIGDVRDHWKVRRVESAVNRRRSEQSCSTAEIALHEGWDRYPVYESFVVESKGRPRPDLLIGWRHVRLLLQSAPDSAGQFASIRKVDARTTDQGFEIALCHVLTYRPPHPHDQKPVTPSAVDTYPPHLDGVGQQMTDGTQVELAGRVSRACKGRTFRCQDAARCDHFPAPESVVSPQQEVVTERIERIDFVSVRATGRTVLARRRVRRQVPSCQMLRLCHLRRVCSPRCAEGELRCFRVPALTKDPSEFMGMSVTLATFSRPPISHA